MISICPQLHVSDQMILFILERGKRHILVALDEIRPITTLNLATKHHTRSSIFQILPDTFKYHR